MRASFDSYPDTELSAFDDQIGERDDVRVAYIRANLSCSPDDGDSNDSDGLVGAH